MSEKESNHRAQDLLFILLPSIENRLSLRLISPSAEIENPKLDHLITLSALTSTFGGIVRPICLAVFKLITSSNFVGCSTGRSAGLAPFRILST